MNSIINPAFINWWQHIPEHINPVFLSIGPLQIHYYGLMYLLSIAVVYFLTLQRIKRENIVFSKEALENFFLWVILGVVIGARLGYVLFYNLGYFLERPWEIVLPFEVGNGFKYIGISGMSYHGGLLGAVIASLVFCLKNKQNFWKLADLLSPAVPLGYTFGRIGNFINGELYGRVTEVWWGMYFPQDALSQLRHPSQLYEAFFEGIVLFIILWRLRKIKYFDGFLFSLYIVGYGVARFFIEFFRQPDPQLGFILGPLTLGQIFCCLMVMAGIALIVIKRRH